MYRVYIEQVESRTSTRDIADRIHRAYFVEMNLLQRNGMNFRLRLSQALEHGARILLSALRELRPCDQFEDVRQMAVALALFDIHVEFRRGDSTAHGFFESELRTCAE